MHILQVSDSNQSIVIIPRSHPVSVSMKLIDESQNTTATPSVSVSSSNGFMTLAGTFSLVDNRYYTLKILDGSNVIYQDRVFVTSQAELDKYTVNEGVYTKETSFNNEFVIL